MEDFVTFELAKKLKQKGFNAECHAYYEPLKHCLNLGRVFKTNSLAENYNCITAPTISQVLKWLRGEKKMHIIIPASFDEGYWWEVRDFNREISEYSDNEFDSYEKAVIAGIDYVLDNLI